MIRQLFDFLNHWYINFILIFLCIFLLFQTSGYPETARAFPQLLLIFMLLLVIVDSAHKIIEITKRPGAKNNQSNEAIAQDTADTKAKNIIEIFSIPKVGVFFAIVLMFIFLLFIHIVGFTIGTFIFVILAAWSLGYKNLKTLFFSTIGITCFMYLIFIVIMKSFLPQGLIIEYFLR
jgi:hypothetical protein